MKRFTVPPDGQWHEIPERPARSIIAPLGCEIDIGLAGTGRVRNTSREPLEVSYTDGPPHDFKLSELMR